MPAPLIAAGLGSLLGSAFGGLVVFLADFLGKRIALGTALAAFLIAGWGALQLAMYAAWTSLGWVLPSDLDVPMQLAKSLLPGNTSLCVQTCILAKIGRWLWDGQRDWARATFNA